MKADNICGEILVINCIRIGLCQMHIGYETAIKHVNKQYTTISLHNAKNFRSVDKKWPSKNQKTKRQFITRKWRVCI